MLRHTLRGCVDWNLSSNSTLNARMSHTLRGCVDWNVFALSYQSVHHVTPFVGVWIETQVMNMTQTAAGVTPFVGVWIETKETGTEQNSTGSHPSWVCGLKQLYPKAYDLTWSHTLRGCVDWNIKKYGFLGKWFCHTLRGCVDWNLPSAVKQARRRESHPSWVCGLKPLSNIVRSQHTSSHPSWVCGLKLRRSWQHRLYEGHTLRGCVDWNIKR